MRIITKVWRGLSAPMKAWLACMAVYMILYFMIAVIEEMFGVTV